MTGAYSWTTNEGTPLSKAAPGVLLNCWDPMGFPLTASPLTNPAHGTLVLNGTGAFTYTPTAGYYGADGFTYQATDLYATSAIGTVSLTINPLPTAVNDQYYTNMNATLTVPKPGVLANDLDASGNPLTVIKQSNPSHGTLTLNSDGSFTYVPATGYSGTDTFTYLVNNTFGNSNTATVSITVNAPPVAAGDSYATDHDTTLTVAAPGVMTHDSDPQGFALTASLVTSPSHGSVQMFSDGAFIYTPNSGYYGPGQLYL